ncbi:MAG TPA: nucleotide exchange factor GrpE [Sphingomicrobium sp.]|nr:nucleotide exchange factor GrpE [Sphingomicrobium sp.]
MTEATKDEEQLHDEAEEIRKETAEESPELAEHDRVAELERQLEEAQSKALYAAAETQNVRRRLEQELQQATSYAAASFARDMLAIKDHLDRALAAVTDELRADKTAAQFLAGIEATARELEAVFQRHGVSRIESVGAPLDPHRHQAMMEIPSDEAEAGTIIEEMQPGYVMKDRLLRPALVGVAKKPD